jgi:hypothetical protein
MTGTAYFSSRGRRKVGHPADEFFAVHLGVLSASLGTLVSTNHQLSFDPGQGYLSPASFSLIKPENNKFNPNYTSASVRCQRTIAHRGCIFIPG